MDYNSSGDAITIKADLTSTVPKYLYLKFEKYTGTGTKIKELELSSYRYLYGTSITFAMPEGFECGDGYVIIKGYERADFKQLCAELIIQPVRFKLF